MKQILLFIIILLLTLYLIVSFIALSFNPESWGLIGRLIFIITFVAGSYFGTKRLLK